MHLHEHIKSLRITFLVENNHWILILPKTKLILLTPSMIMSLGWYFHLFHGPVIWTRVPFY